MIMIIIKTFNPKNTIRETIAMDPNNNNSINKIYLIKKTILKVRCIKATRMMKMMERILFPNINSFRIVAVQKKKIQVKN